MQMFQKCKYLISKLFTLTLIKYNNFKIQECLLLDKSFLHPCNQTKNLKIAVVFFNSQLTHIGDQLFFDPLIQNLSYVTKNLYILPTQPMRSYFLSLKQKILSAKDFNANDYDLIIGRIEEYNYFKHFLHKTILVNTVARGTTQRICESIVKNIFAVLKEKPKAPEIKPRIPNSSSLNIFDPNKHYLVYNNYVDSGWFRLKQKDFKILEQAAINLAEKYNLTILHVGTQKNKQEDTNILNYKNYIDLRGETSIEDTFQILASPQVDSCVTFDTFVFHAASLTNTVCYVRIKNSSSEKLQYLLRCIVPCFNMTDTQAERIFILDNLKSKRLIDFQRKIYADL